MEDRIQCGVGVQISPQDKQHETSKKCMYMQAYQFMVSPHSSL